jgi:NAD(P)-dependent dehydrogenase (short-subunit alcohol dehydrogenase family)
MPLDATEFAKEFEGRVAVITGSGAGIGRATAARLAAGGATVVITDKHEGRMREAVDEVGAAHPDAVVTGHLLDIEHRDEFDDLFTQVERDVGPIQIYVWNAALNVPEPIFEQDPELLDRILYANVNNCWYSCTRVVDQMRRAGGGSIVMCGSFAADTGAASGEPAYALSKAALRNLMNGLVKAGGPFNVRVNEVSMGFVSGTRFADTHPEMVENFLNSVPLGRLASTEDVAEAIAFLVSERASFVTGTVVNLSGGQFVRL